ncbi:hypothetical protein [Scytonema sp. PCC 10023]|uniref:hypothetical protein n=1 Tax=Scytonema sp. PCC 10023 TaxID=1680591 RepID=UPI0039C68DA8
MISVKNVWLLLNNMRRSRSAPYCPTALRAVAPILGAGEAFLEETPRQYAGDRHLCNDFHTKKRKGAIIQLCTFACLLFIHLIKL